MSPLYLAWTTAVLAFGAGGSASDAVDSNVTGLQILPSLGQTEVLITLDGAVEIRDFTMEGPYRIVLDLMDARLSFGSNASGDVGRGGIQRVRASQYATDVVRVVLEVDHPMDYLLMAGDGYVRVSMDNPGDAFEPWQELAVSTGPSPAPAASVPAPQPVDAATASVRPQARERPAQWSGIARTDFAPRITVSFTNTNIRDVLFTFAEFSDRSIVPGAGVTGTVNAEIRDQPWDVALQAILESHGLAAQEAASGIIRVDELSALLDRESVEQLTTRSFRVNFGNAGEMQGSIESLLSERGRVSVSQSTNSLVVTDVPRVLEAVEELVEGLDLQTPEISIGARIIFVNRTDLHEFGVSYELKDTRGNQFNVLTPGGIETPGGFERVEQGTSVVSLGGNSIAALGNANQRVTSPSVEFLTSLILGRHTLNSFVEALQSRTLSEVQAAPQVRVLDNQEARILVGERTPIRVVDAGGQAGPGDAGVFPQATVQIEETGIMLEVTPHVTAGDLILLELRAERSGIELAPEADVGFIFNTQEAATRVLVEDGETVVIGGLTVTERDDVRAGIPLLMDLPVLGRFFRLTRQQTVQRDLMILVTPQINRR